MLDFEFIEDKIYFSKLLCEEGEDISKYSKLFDFRNPHIKRREFNKIRNSVLNQSLKSENYNVVLVAQKRFFFLAIET